ncbi:glucosephosphate isomerase [Escherichia coli]|uniref:Glucosephosphate isomerase n=1 Tax=Escherichia coli TaxID=562 RepID=A0A376L3D7_ECOLX|nr:glucosephosphate isomerase [Escherichia coli]
MKNINPTQTAAWQALQKHFDEMKDVTIADLFAKDGDRFSKFSATFGRSDAGGLLQKPHH